MSIMSNPKPPTYLHAMQWLEWYAATHEHVAYLPSCRQWSYYHQLVHNM